MEVLLFSSFSTRPRCVTRVTSFGSRKSSIASPYDDSAAFSGTLIATAARVTRPSGEKNNVSWCCVTRTVASSSTC